MAVIPNVFVSPATPYSEHSAADNGSYTGCYSHRGDHIYVGSGKGVLSVIETATRKVTLQTRMQDMTLRTAIKGIACSGRGNFLLVNAQDRTIRAMPLDATTGHPIVSLTVKYRDHVQSCQWSTACFSPDEDFVVAGTQVKGIHEIYIWDRLTGNLKRKLEGPSEGGSLIDLAVGRANRAEGPFVSRTFLTTFSPSLRSLQWHPYRPIFATISQEDRVYIWANSTKENWSAFAPDFREVHENTEYREMEDEFDIVGLPPIP